MNVKWPDALVLAAISNEEHGDYAYHIANKIVSGIPLSETAVYNVCKRLKDKLLLTEYDNNYKGRNRRYYQITKKGQLQLKEYQEEWLKYSTQMNIMLYINY